MHQRSPPSREEVVKAREGREVLLEDEHALGLDDLADLAVRVVRGCRTCARPVGHASRHAGMRPLRVRCRQKVHFSTTPLKRGRFERYPWFGLIRSGGTLRRAPVEAAREIRARHDAEPAADAPAVVDHDDAIGLLPRRADRTRLHAGRVVALVALHGQVELALRGDLLVVVVRRWTPRSRASPPPSPARGCSESPGRPAGCSRARRPPRSAGSRCTPRG